MRAREAEIWGSTEFPSAVQVRVKINNKHVQPCGAWEEYVNRDGDYRTQFNWNSPFDIQRGQRYNKPLSYALFPFTGEAPKRDRETGRYPRQQDGANCVVDCEFDLTLEWPTSEQLSYLRRKENEARRSRGEAGLLETIPAFESGKQP